MRNKEIKKKSSTRLNDLVEALGRVEDTHAYISGISFSLEAYST